MPGGYPLEEVIRHGEDWLPTSEGGKEAGPLHISFNRTPVMRLGGGGRKKLHYSSRYLPVS